MFTFTHDPTCPHCGADLTKPESIVAAVSDSDNPANGATVYIDPYGYVADGYVTDSPGTHVCLDDPATIFSCLHCLNRLDVTPEEEV